jgi:hypothetical protein
MVNKVLFNYLKTNKDKYNLGDLRREIMRKGYSEDEINEALKVIMTTSSVGIKKGNLLPTSNIAHEKSFGWIKFVLIICLILLAGVGLIILMNNLGFDFFGWNFFDK